MQPSDLIRNHLGEEAWNRCRAVSTSELSPVEELSPFPSSKTYRILGQTSEYDFATLPRGSYCLYDANRQRAIRLTREGKEIETVLRENWQLILKCDPLKLASLILKFFDGGIRATHHVLMSAESLCSYGKHYVLDEREFEKTRERIETTRILSDENRLTIRAVTLCGWMHNKRNLGIEHIDISQSGEIHLGDRDVLSQKIFKRVPGIRY